MVGLPATVIKTQLGPLLNGVINYEFWVPTPTMIGPEALDFIKQYQERASGRGRRSDRHLRAALGLRASGR